MSKAARVVSKCFPGSSVDDMCHYAIPTIKKKPDKVILHVGTNNIPEAESARHIAEKIVDLATFIEKESPHTKVTISSLITRKDSEAFKPKIEETNKILKSFATQRSWNFIDHKTINDSCLNNGGLHLNKKGHGLLIKNMINYLKIN